MSILQWYVSELLKLELSLSLSAGMLSITNHNLLTATALFTAAAALRSNGLMLAGFIIWPTVVEPILARKRVSLIHV